MNKYEIVHVIRSLSFSDYFEFLEWLYGNDYEIIKVEDTTEVKPKSKFMEEWEKERVYADIFSDDLEKDRWLMSKLINLIDKHKADK